MSIAFKVKAVLRNRRWRKYWKAQDERNHIAYYRALAQDWKTRSEPLSLISPGCTKCVCENCWRGP